MDTYGAVRARIFELCEEKKMAIYKLSVLSGVAPSTIKNILYGKSKNPGVVTLKMICDGFGITLEEFFDSDLFRGETEGETGVNVNFRPTIKRQKQSRPRVFCAVGFCVKLSFVSTRIFRAGGRRAKKTILRAAARPARFYRTPKVPPL